MLGKVWDQEQVEPEMHENKVHSSGSLSTERGREKSKSIFYLDSQRDQVQQKAVVIQGHRRELSKFVSSGNPSSASSLVGSNRNSPRIGRALQKKVKRVAEKVVREQTKEEASRIIVERNLVLYIRRHRAKKLEEEERRKKQEEEEERRRRRGEANLAAGQELESKKSLQVTSAAKLSGQAGIGQFRMSVAQPLLRPKPAQTGVKSGISKLNAFASSGKENTTEGLSSGASNFAIANKMRNLLKGKVATAMGKEFESKHAPTIRFSKLFYQIPLKWRVKIKESPAQPTEPYSLLLEANMGTHKISYQIPIKVKQFQKFLNENKESFQTVWPVFLRGLEHEFQERSIRFLEDPEMCHEIDLRTHSFSFIENKSRRVLETFKQEDIIAMGRAKEMLDFYIQYFIKRKRKQVGVILEFDKNQQLSFYLMQELSTSIRNLKRALQIDAPPLPSAEARRGFYEFRASYRPGLPDIRHYEELETFEFESKVQRLQVLQNLQLVNKKNNNKDSAER